MKLYRFSPIDNNETCLQVLEYIQNELRKLSNLVMDEELPINTLKIFAHYSDEYDFLRKWVDTLGTPDKESSSTSYYVKPNSQIVINGDPTDYLGIRTPDPYRPQVGCGDYVINNFDELKAKYINKSPFFREVTHKKYHMLELFHPDIDVLGYIVKDYS